ncbi:DnaD domain protein [Enterococcus sp. CSURQ0835]|uniref:DnaD domain protein n=1 Tax=Enterococcus sp. CSURQ0835 TaxID=2681394 RepID=UPI00135743E9|nr:DnaD domain protein [Enterococcus sp. CSURQ0835]
MLELPDYLNAGQTVLSNLVLQKYHDLGLSTAEFMLWLQLYSRNQAGDLFPDLNEIAQAMGQTPAQVYELLARLEAGGFLTIETQKNAEGKQSDRYNLLPLFDKLADLKQLESFQQAEQSEEQAVKQMYQNIEQEFGRPLTAIEYQEVGYWLNDDHYSPELINLALREAVLNQAFSFRYMERILLDWAKKNIQSKEQVLEEKKRRDQAIMQKKEIAGTKELPKVSLYNWLEGENSDAE